MSFPDSSRKNEQYYVGGQILAEVSGTLLHTSPDPVSEPWATTMRRIASADDVAETNPDYFTSGEGVVEYLGLQPNADLVNAGASLLKASNASGNAETLREYAQSRAQEAWHTLGLLRHQSPDTFRRPEQLWGQLFNISAAGIDLDSLYDAREDAKVLTQFSARQLALGSTWQFVQHARQINPSTWYALLKSSRRHELDIHLAKKILHPFTPSAERIK